MDPLNSDENNSDVRIAVLIDAENVSAYYVRPMLEEIARYGTPTIKRIYADWTAPVVSGWKAVLLENAIVPVQQYSYTQGKNSSDSAMIIDAMDILYANKIDTFCLVSSDSDFTRLATRLREAGKKVIGIGEMKTPAAFISGCDKFIFLEILAPRTRNKTPAKTFTEPERARREVEKPAAPAHRETLRDKPVTDAVTAASAAKPAAKREPDKPAAKAAAQNGADDKLKDVLDSDELTELLVSSVQDLADEDGWAALGAVGNLLIKKQPSFDSRNYGYQKLKTLIASTGLFDIDKRTFGGSPAGVAVYVRVKAQSAQ